MGTTGGVLLGAAIGALCTSFGLIDTSLGQIAVYGGNEWTPFVTGLGTLIGATVGATPFFRHHIFSFVLTALGLILAIAFRDRYLLQPPAVFLDLFGIPLIGTLLGVFLDRWRRREKSPAVVALRVKVPSVLQFVSCRLLRTTACHCEACRTMTATSVSPTTLRTPTPDHAQGSRPKPGSTKSAYLRALLGSRRLGDLRRGEGELGANV